MRHACTLQLARMLQRVNGTSTAPHGGHMKTIVCSALLASAALVGCADEPDVEDGENAVFLTDDAKADGFGVEDWSPDGMAVLKLVSTTSAAKLENDVGLSARAAK